MTLEPITEGLWSAQCSISPAPGVRMDTRMTVIRLPSGGLLLHSPIRLESDPADSDAPSTRLAEDLEALGPVEHLVAPNLYHHFFLAEAKQRWPDAAVWAPAGLSDKVRNLPSCQSLTASESWLDCLDVFVLAGMPKFQEHVFFHRPSKTLMVTDLVFNRPAGHTALARLFFRFAGTHEKLAVSKLFKGLIKDRGAFRDSLEAVLELPLERVIMAHGLVLADDARERFRQVITAVF